jgi:hypothetical protein
VVEGDSSSSVGQGNQRVSVFDEDGNFLHAFGWGADTGAAALEVCTTVSGCQAGIEGSGAGQLNIAPGASGDIVARYRPPLRDAQPHAVVAVIRETHLCSWVAP